MSEYLGDYITARDVRARIEELESERTALIDWEQAVRELQMDYSSYEYDGTTYWVHA